jgi:hypothetical protein
LTSSSSLCHKLTNIYTSAYRTAIGLGIYGNQQVHVSIYSFKDDIDTANTTLLLATMTVSALRDELMGVYGILQRLPNG